MAPRNPVRIAKWLGLGYGVGLGLFELTGAPDAPDVLIMLPLFWLWQIGPAALAEMLVKAARTPLGAWFFVGVETLVVGSASWFLIDVWFHPRRWGSVGGPVIQGV